MKKDKKEIKEYNEEGLEDLPLATMVIQEYQKTNNNLIKSKSIWIALTMILLLFLTIETVYIIVTWDTMHPEAGIIRVKCDD